MFTRYWRTYPWFLQVFLFAMMILTFLGLASTVLYLMPKFTGYSIQDVFRLNPASPVRLIRAALYVQGITHLLTFAVPCLLFAYLTHPRPGRYLWLRAPANRLHWLLVPVIMVGLMMMILYAEAFITTHFRLSEGLQREQARVNDQMGAMLSLRQAGDLVMAFIIMAALPALGEELMFRGLFMRFAHKRSRGMLFPVLISATFFMLVHDNPVGMPLIFIAGVTLALIFWLTGSLWCSILGHFLFNGIQIALSYLVNQQPAAENQALPAWLPAAGLVLFAGAGYLLLKTRHPLPANWSDDFRDEQPGRLQPGSPFSLS